MQFFDVYEAKKRAQAAPGVGELTDIGIIDQENGIVYLTEAEETNLMTIYEKKVDILFSALFKINFSEFP